MAQKNSAEDRTAIQLRRAVFLVSLPFGILGFLLPIYGKELGASALEIGGFFSAFSLVPALIRPFLGRALDRWGRRPFLLLGLLGYLLATLVFALADTVLLLTLARFMQGIGSAFLWIAAFTMVADLAGSSRRGEEFGSLEEASYRGAIVGTTAGLVIFFSLQGAAGLPTEKIWSWLFLAYSVPVLGALGLGWAGTRETRPDGAAGAGEVRGISRQLLVLMGIVLLTGASQAMVWPLLMIFLQDHLQAGVGALAAAYLPAALLSSFLPSRMGKIADRWGRKKPMMAGLLIGAAASLLIPGLKSVFALAALWAVETIGYTVSIPAERAFVADIAGQNIRGSSYGLYTFSFFLGAAVGPLAGGWLYDNLSQAMPFYLNTAVLVLGALLVGLALREPSPGPGPDQLTTPRV